MYARPDDRVDDRQAAVDLLRHSPFVQLVSMTDKGLAATGLPMLVDGDNDRLIGHLARANRQWRTLDGVEALVIAPVSDAYISPSWYPSKVESGGRAVPTWNYEVVHVHGKTTVHHDEAWLSDVVTRLSAGHEASRTDGGERWAVTDAPSDFIDQQLRAIVGVSVQIDRIEAKRKLSRNRSDLDRFGARDGLRATDGAPTHLVEAMSEP